MSDHDEVERGPAEESLSLENVSLTRRTLLRLGDNQKLAYVLKGRAHRLYTRESVVGYLMTRAKECQSSSPSVPTEAPKVRSSNTASRSGSTGNRKSSLAQQVSERAALLKGWKQESVKRPD